MHQLTLLSKTRGSRTEDYELFHPAEGKLKPDLQPSTLAHQHSVTLYWNSSLLKKAHLHYTTVTDVHKGTRRVFKPLRHAQTPPHFGCSKCSLVWWVLKPLGAHRGYARDFRYGSSVYLPTTGGCLLLWRHLSRWGLLTCLSYATRWAVMTQAFHRANRSLKRARKVSVTHAITLPAVSIIPRKHRAAVESLQPSNTDTVLDLAWMCMHLSTMMCLHVFCLCMYVCSNKAAMSSMVSCV